MLRTVGELKEYIKNLPDDMLLVKEEITMEISGFRNKLFLDVTKMKEEVKQGYDAFDGEPFEYKVFVPAEEGTECLRLL